MNTPKTARKSPSLPAGNGADDKSAPSPRIGEGAKPAKPPRKRRPRFVL